MSFLGFRAPGPRFLDFFGTAVFQGTTDRLPWDLLEHFGIRPGPQEPTLKPQKKLCITRNRDRLGTLAPYLF